MDFLILLPIFAVSNHLVSHVSLNISPRYMLRPIIISLFSFIAIMLPAQVKVSGTVIDSADNEPIAGASVSIKGADGKIKKFASSGADGKFTMTMPSTEGCVLEASMIGYGKKRIELAGKSFPLTVKMSAEAFKLKEVAVKADRIRENGDTITYNVAGFAEKQDKTIGDVLNRMPGIDVDKSGKIKYQGTAINKFYIEGSDLLGGKYGIATKGIAHEDIGTVEVMENHQPMQVLRGLSFSDQAAINLKMKNSSKATLLVHGNIGGGYSNRPEGALWNGDIFTMMVTGNYQMITTLKGNNSGSNLRQQLFNFIGEREGENLEGYINLSSPHTPGLNMNRTLMNRSWMVSSSHLLKNKKGGEFKAQIDYVKDRVTAQSGSVTTYFLETSATGGAPDGYADKIIVENKNALWHTDEVTGKFSYELNEKKYYLNNTLDTKLGWNDMTLGLYGSLDNEQKARTPEYSVTNNLKMIRRFGSNHLVTFTSLNEWMSHPERLTVEQKGIRYGQKVGQHSFLTDERASYGLVLKGIVISLEGGVSGYFRDLNTNLWGMDALDYPKENDMTTNYLRFYVSPKFEYNYRKLEFLLSVPLNFYNYFFSSGLDNRSELFAAPRLVLRWKITPRMQLSVSGSARRSPASMHNIHPGVTLSDYRTLQGGIDDYYSSSGQSVSMSYRYRYPRHGVFLFANAAHSWRKLKFGSVQDLVGDYVIYSYRNSPSSAQNSTFMANVSKALDFMRGSIGFIGSYLISDRSIVSQGREMDYSNRSLGLSGNINGGIASWFNWSYKFEYLHSQLRMDRQASQSTNDYQHTFSVAFTPGRKFRWSVSGELYRNELEPDRYKDLFMLDTKVAYNISRRVEISATLSNMLNRKEYSYKSYGQLSEVERTSNLRGREFLISIYLKK